MSMNIQVELREAVQAKNIDAIVKLGSEARQIITLLEQEEGGEGLLEIYEGIQDDITRAKRDVFMLLNS